MAISPAPEEPNICCSTAVPTRSEEAYLMPRATTSVPAGLPSNGRCARKIKFAATYNRITTPVPTANESGKLRLGFFTSPAVKVTLFQASADKSEPTCATARIVSVPTKTVGPPTPTCTACCAPKDELCQKFP